MRGITGKYEKLLCLMIFVLMFLSGLFATKDYGIPYDEPTEQTILLGNLREMAEQLVGEESAIVYRFEEMGITAIGSSVEADHGIAAYYPFGVLWQGYEMFSGDSLEGMRLHLLWSGYTYLICFTGLICLFLLVKELYASRILALCASLMFFLSPRFFAELHYNNKDLVLLVLLINSFCFAVLTARKNRYIDVLLFSFFAAMMCNTKLVGLFFFGAEGLVYIAYVTLRKLWSRDRAVKTALAVVLTFLLYYALTPAMWTDPLGFFAWSYSNMFEFSRWNGQLLFEGIIYTPGVDLPRYYLIKLIGITTPLFVLLPAVFGFCVLVRDCVRRKMEDEAFFVLAGVVCSMLPLLVMCIAGSKVYNGWRHAYFAYMGVLLLSGFGLYHMIKHMARPTYAALAICLVYSCALIAVNHPYQYVYYNVLAGADPGSRYETDYWCLSSYNAISRILAEEKTEEKLNIAAVDLNSASSLFRSLALLEPEEALRIERAANVRAAVNDTEADYIISNRSHWYTEGRAEPPEGFIHAFSIEAYGSEVLRVYRRAQ